ncbi:MAG: hypothetical protein J6P46_08540 [Bacteroidales bacterium]|nr:hypothetical protein [Bacteroidales bacterium]
MKKKSYALLVNEALGKSDFNSLPEAERKRIRIYRTETQVLTLFQLLYYHADHTTPAWKKHVSKWLDNALRDLEKQRKEAEQ